MKFEEEEISILFNKFADESKDKELKLFYTQLKKSIDFSLLGLLYRDPHIGTSSDAIWTIGSESPAEPQAACGRVIGRTWRAPQH